MCAPVQLRWCTHYIWTVVQVLYTLMLFLYVHNMCIESSCSILGWIQCKVCKILRKISRSYASLYECRHKSSTWDHMQQLRCMKSTRHSTPHTKMQTFCHLCCFVYEWALPCQTLGTISSLLLGHKWNNPWQPSENTRFTPRESEVSSHDIHRYVLSRSVIRRPSSLNTLCGYRAVTEAHHSVKEQLHSIR